MGFGTRASRAIADRDREARRDLPPGHMPRVVPVLFTEFVPSLGLQLTFGQTVFSRVAFDGLDPAGLTGEQRSLAIEMFGGVEQVPARARKMNVGRLGRSSGKTTLCGAYALYTMLTADVSQAGPGDQPAFISIAPTRRTSALSVQMAMSLVEQSPDLRPRVVHANSEGFSLRRYDGRRVQFRALPKSRGGAAARGMSILGAIFDESEFLPIADVTATISDRDIVQAIMPRLMRGARVWFISTPWPVASLTAEIFDENYGNPTTALCARAPTMVMRDHDEVIAEAIDIERHRDPANAAREFDCINVTTGEAFFDGEQINAAVSHIPRGYAGSKTTSVGIDVAFKGDSSTLVAVERQGERLVVIRVEERQPSRGEPLAPSAVIGEFAGIARDLGSHELVCDGHYIESVREIALQAGVQAVQGPMNVRGKERVHLYLRELLREGKIVLPNHPKLLAQLRAVKSRPTAGGGMTIVSERSSGGHGDLVSALVQACMHDHRFGPVGRPAATRSNFTAGVSRGAPMPVRGRFSNR